MPRYGSRPPALRLTALVVAALAGAAPGAASASSCDERQIAGYTAEQAAQSIWDHSDVIGFGVVSIINNIEREQWFVDMLVTLKGEADQRIALAPVRVGRVGDGSSGVRALFAKPGEIAFVTLVRTAPGFVTPDCRTVLIDRNRTAIIRSLTAMSLQSGSNQDRR